jgi:hypothetical protein
VVCSVCFAPPLVGVSARALSVALLKLTALYGLLPTDALEYTDILFAP